MRRRVAFAAAGLLAMSAWADDLGGDWKVVGERFDGPAHLPGTLADAELGAEQSYETWQALTNPGCGSTIPMIQQPFLRHWTKSRQRLSIF